MKLRQLVWMRDGHAKSEWSRWSALMALIAEVKRDRRLRLAPFTPAEFDPTRDDDSDVIEGSVATLAALIPGASYQPHAKPETI
ncbi:MAG: hypothetical protein AAF958_00800 [Planctomycetota bacterium]